MVSDMDNTVIFMVLYAAGGFLTVFFERKLEDEGVGLVGAAEKMRRWLRVTVRVAFLLLWPIPAAALVAAFFACAAFSTLRCLVRLIIE